MNGQAEQPGESSQVNRGKIPLSARRSARWLWLVVVLLIGQMAAAMLASSAEDSPTFDEPGHIASGLAYVYLHDLRFNIDHPPVTQLLAGVALRVGGIEPPRSAPELANLDSIAARGQEFEALYGARILYRSGYDPGHVLWLARLPLIFLTLLFALAAFGFARDLFGWSGGLFTLAAVSFCPTIIANGRLVNTDVPWIGFTLVSVWWLWKARHENGWWLIPAGLGFGLSLASKYSALLILPLMMLLAALAGWRSPTNLVRVPRWLRAAGWSIAFTALSLTVIWATYLAIDPHLRFERPTPLANSAQGELANIADRLPVPEPYVKGIQHRTADDQRLRRAFLRGTIYRGGRIDYFPYALSIKTPLGIMALWLIGLGAITVSRRHRESLAWILAPPLTSLLFAMLSHINIGVRHVAIVPLFMSVAVGGIGVVRRRWLQGVAVVLLVASALSVWRVFPSYIAYANEAAGGPERLTSKLLDSNVDWGQDLRRLRTYLDEHYPDRRVALLYFGTVPPDGYGFDASNSWDLNTETPTPTADMILAVSASAALFDPDRVNALRALGYSDHPTARVGYSILIFDPRRVQN